MSTIKVDAVALREVAWHPTTGVEGGPMCTYTAHIQVPYATPHSAADRALCEGLAYTHAPWMYSRALPLHEVLGALDVYLGPNCEVL